MNGFGLRLGMTGLAVALALGGAGGREKAGAPSAEVPKVGQTIANFTLKDQTGKPWELAAAKVNKAVVVVFVGTQCPLNNVYMARLGELHAEYQGKGVAFVAINANQQDTAAEIARHAQEHKLPFPVLKDDTGTVADAFSARRTPEVFLLDDSRSVRYRGRIDDQFGIGFKRPKPTRRDLAEALEEVLAGKPVTTAITDAPGCIIARTRRPVDQATVTYTKQVATILQKNCQECHRPGQIGPMPLLDYDDAFAWAESIREVVRLKRMPPWYADPKHGKFENDRSLTAKDRETLIAWAEQGCAQGDEKDLAPNPTFAEGWRIGKPDAVFTLPDPVKVPAKAPRGSGIPYRYVLVTTDYAEDRWIQAVEAKAGSKAVVHHILVYVRAPGKFQGQPSDGIGDGLLVAYAPGDLPSTFPVGMAKKLPKGGVIVFQIHYTPNGTEQVDQSSVGLVFAKTPPQHEVHTRAVAQARFSIPPGADNHKVTSTSTMRKDAVLLSMFPHMHLRGKSFEYKVAYPDGKSEVLLSVPRYNFDWQNNYNLAKPLALPAGTKIECTAFFDNSAGNPNNPDPTKTVRWGEQTWEEMMIGFMDYYYVVKADEEKK